MDSWLNQEALNKALNIYRAAMRSFIIFHLKRIPGTNVEDVVIDSVGDWRADEIDRILSESDRDIESVIDINDFPHLVHKNWGDAFERTLNDDKTFRNQLWLIVECRNADWAHPPEGDAECESTRAHLFLIADVLGKINKSDAKDRVEVIRDGLDDTAERLADTEERLKEMEAENVEYKKSIAEVAGHLETEKSEKFKYEKDNATLSKQIDEKEKRLKKLSKQLKNAKAATDKYKKNLAGTKQRLEKSETEKNDHKKHLETTSTELESVKVERSTFEERLTATSNELVLVQAKKNASERYLTVTRNLLTTVAIGDQAVFPSLGTDSTVRILDRRNIDKKNYILNLLEQKQPVIIYVQSEEKIDELLVLVGPEKAAVIGRHDERTSETEETEILEKLENRELIAVVSNATFSTLAPSNCVEHFVFCHLVPSLDTFFKRCQPAFTPENNNYLHLIYNNEEDIAGLNQWLTQKYPDKEALRESYRELKELATANGGYVKLEEVYNALNMVELEVATGLVIFEELGFLERDGKGTITLFLSPIPRGLEESDTYRRGEELKKETAEFRAFQLEYSIEQIWEEILERLNIESEQILRENSIHEIPFRISETEGDYLKDSQMPAEQSTEMVEKDSGVSDEIAETDHAIKPRRANAKVTDKTKYRKKKHSIAERYVAETTVEDRDGIAAKVVELRINATGSKPLAWKKIREKLGLQNAQFHEVIRHSEGYRKAVIQRIKSLKAQEGGWEYNGKLEVLTGIELTEKELE